MAGKFENKQKKQNRKSGSKSWKKAGKWAVAAVLLLVCTVVVAYFMGGSADSQKNTEVQQNTEIQKTPEPSAELTESTEGLPAESVLQEVNLGQGLVLKKIGPYTGMYVEDGSNELVSGVMMAVVTNDSDKDLEYAQITVHSENEEALFTVTALPKGKTAVLLEKTRKEYSAQTEYDSVTADGIAFFQKPLTCMEETFMIQGLNGALNVTNTAAEDITEDIIICYKNTDGNYLYGGIAYRVKIEGGLKAGEIRQIMTEHFAGEGSAVIYVNLVEAT